VAGAGRVPRSRRLLRDTPKASLQRRIHQLMALTMAGVRPRDWNQTLVPQPPRGVPPPRLAMCPKPSARIWRWRSPGTTR
jgi:hypothetical protein